MSDRANRIGVLFAGVVFCAHAQWLNYPTPGTPRTPDGKPNLSARRRAPPMESPIFPGSGGPSLRRLAKTSACSAAVGDFAVPGDDPRTFSEVFPKHPGGLQTRRNAHAPRGRRTVPEELRRGGERKVPRRAVCRKVSRAPISSPMLLSKSSKPRGSIAVLYEVDNTHRQIYTDGRKLPVDPQPAWLGYSVGRWEGDTLVVDAAGFNDRSWLDSSGHPHSEDLRVQERFHRRDFGHMDLSVTVEDPKMYTRPFTIQVTELLLPDSDILEIDLQRERERPDPSRTRTLNGS